MQCCIENSQGVYSPEKEEDLPQRVISYRIWRHLKVIVRAGGISEVCRQWLLQLWIFYFIIYFLPMGRWYFSFCFIFSVSLIWSYDFIFHIIISCELMKGTCANAISECHKSELFRYISRNLVIFHDVFRLI